MRGEFAGRRGEKIVKLHHLHTRRFSFRILSLGLAEVETENEGSISRANEVPKSISREKLR